MIDETYIREQFGGEFPIIHQIIKRFVSGAGHGRGSGESWVEIQDLDGLILDIVGYYTGCLRADGTARGSR